MAASPLIVYNLFPTLAGPPDRWLEHARRARRMHFDWLYVNPVHYPGFSGSLYAIKEHERLHPALAPGDGAARLDALRPALRAIDALGLRTMMDLVVNHVAKDSPLVTEHAGWFRRDASGQPVSPSAIDPADANQVTVWGDLAEIDNEGAEDRDGLWAFWERLVRRGLDVGFAGFRCDAAYKVPAELWRRLIGSARAVRPDVLFVAETLGCRLEEMAALAGAGFDFFYNSSKWWDFEAPWCLEQHAQFGQVAPSIAFPESHDTDRLAAETHGNAAVQRQRYAFAACFSGGVQLTMGYEFGFRRRLDVVTTRPEDWEATSFDLTAFVARVNALKRGHPLLAAEGRLWALDGAGPDITLLRRWSDAQGTHRGLVLVNRNTAEEREARVRLDDLGAASRLYRPWDDAIPSDGTPLALPVRLAPGEVALIAAPLPVGAIAP